MLQRIITKGKRHALRSQHAIFVKRSQRKSEKVQPLIDVIRMIRPVEINEELVRVGSPNDGGYLLPESATNQDVLLSPGVSWNSSFEYFFSERGAICYLFDASVEEPAIMHEGFHFYRKFWGVEDSGDTIDASSWISERLDAKKRNALQMDVEGAEFDIMNSLSDEILKMFNLIVIEVHGFQNLLDPEREDSAYCFFQKLTRNHRVVHFHPNNNISPTKFHGIDVIDCFELTLIRHDYPYFKGRDGDFSAHILDMPCVMDEREIKVNWDSFCSQ